MTVVFIHGAGFDGSVFAHQAGALAGSHAPNLPGHLTAGSPASIAEFAEFIETYVRAEGIDDAVLCGHSMGGAVAIETALRNAVAVRGLVLAGSGARLRVAPAILEQLETDFDAAILVLANLFFADPTPERVEWAVGHMKRIGPAQTRRDFLACDAFDALDRLGELSMPLLALTGEADRMTPPKFAQALAGRVPQGQARIIAGAGHFVMVEQASETTHALRAFLMGIQQS